MERSVAPGAASPASSSASVWEDFIDIFYTPSTVFARRERGSFWIPLLVVSLLIGILFVVNARVMDPIMEAETRRGMAKAMSDPRMTPEAAEQMRGMAAMMSGVAKVMGFFSPGFVILGVAFILWIAGKVVGATQTWHAALVVAAYSYVPRVVEGVIACLQGFLVSPEQLDGRYRISLGAGRFLDPDTTSPVLIALLGRLDLFTIWVTILLAIGLAVTGRIDRGRAALAGVLMWVLGSLFGVVPAFFA